MPLVYGSLDVQLVVEVISMCHMRANACMLNMAMYTFYHTTTTTTIIIIIINNNNNIQTHSLQRMMKLQRPRRWLWEGCLGIAVIATTEQLQGGNFAPNLSDEMVVAHECCWHLMRVGELCVAGDECLSTFSQLFSLVSFASFACCLFHLQIIPQTSLLVNS